MAHSEEPPKRKRGGGPKTSQGKQRSSFNSCQHGTCCRAHVVLPHESQQEYDDLSTLMLREFHPGSPFECDLVQQAIDARWRALRAERNLFELESVLYGKQKSMALWPAEDLQRFELFQRYKTRDINAYHKQLRSIEFHRKSERSSETFKDQSVAGMMNDLRLPDKVSAAQDVLRNIVYSNRDLPLERTDGGCECINCLWKWGTAELQRQDDLEEQMEKQEKQTPADNGQDKGEPRG